MAQSFKFYNGEVVRRVGKQHFLGANEQPTWDMFCARLSALFGAELPQHYTVQYKDVDGDMVTLASTAELLEALQQTDGCLAFRITQATAPTATVVQAVVRPHQPATILSTAALEQHDKETAKSPHAVTEESTTQLPFPNFVPIHPVVTPPAEPKTQSNQQQEKELLGAAFQRLRLGAQMARAHKEDEENSKLFSTKLDEDHPRYDGREAVSEERLAVMKENELQRKLQLDQKRDELLQKYTLLAKQKQEEEDRRLQQQLAAQEAEKERQWQTLLSYCGDAGRLKLQSMLVSQLKTMCADNKLPTTGKKNEIVERLVAFYEDKTGTAKDDEEVIEISDEDRPQAKPRQFHLPQKKARKWRTEMSMLWEMGLTVEPEVMYALLEEYKGNTAHVAQVLANSCKRT
eukprot:TRINITY_DN93999_c0_g1_i1.p1 TRINITY_DN93999_c0_g1~~TRINITY_DN93999_c0_g1_i1.p1  ORF type:complete len:420 (+),score=76.44 TRINITY_DN93999_c0_g1_i1:52-1260(+)